MVPPIINRPQGALEKRMPCLPRPCFAAGRGYFQTPSGLRATRRCAGVRMGCAHRQSRQTERRRDSQGDGGQRDTPLGVRSRSFRTVPNRSVSFRLVPNGSAWFRIIPHGACGGMTVCRTPRFTREPAHPTSYGQSRRAVPDLHVTPTQPVVCTWPRPNHGVVMRPIMAEGGCATSLARRGGTLKFCLGRGRYERYFSTM